MNRTSIIFSSIIFCFFSCNEIKKEENFLFYDFNFNISFYNHYGKSEEICYESDNSNIDSLKIYNIRYFDNGHKLLNPVKDSFYISKQQMDTVYQKISKKMNLDYTTNKSNEKIPRLKISSSEWKYCTVDLDLKYRGNKHSLTTTLDYDYFYNIFENNSK